MDNATGAISKADLAVVIGTSLQVYPVNQLPELCKGKKAYINLDTGRSSSQFDLVVEGSKRCFDKSRNASGLIYKIKEVSLCHWK